MSKYKDAGVDVNAGYELVKRIKPLVKKTQRSGFSGDIGSFGGVFDLSVLNYKSPLLVAGTDGVGTKLLIAQMMKQHKTIGIDCVAMCVNDILAQGAEPLYFLDYIATGKNDIQTMVEIVKGVTEGCKEAGISLIGGETAEMPDMYDYNEYDLAGFSMGVVEKNQILTQETPKQGDILIGLPSSGLHSNGFSLVRKILLKDHNMDLLTKIPEFDNKTLGEVLLTPTKIYVKEVLPLLKDNLVHGISHITGGGLVENLPRMYSEKLRAKVDLSTWEIPMIFKYLGLKGDLSWKDQLETFNLGIGMVLAIPPDKLTIVKQYFQQKEIDFYEIGYLDTRNNQQDDIEFVRG